MKKVVLILIPSIVCGCSSGLPKLVYPPTDPETIEFTNTLLKGAELLQRVNGLSCYKGVMGWEPPDKREAEENLKKAAAEIGATGVFRVSYRPAPILTGCVKQGLQASGMAFRRVQE